ncbi:MAG: Flp pilus assembly protein TadG [Rhizobiales bacterium]|nr:Flp pilus assembly protein TadG [Hyphomicrobiales bacterium]
MIDAPALGKISKPGLAARLGADQRGAVIAIIAFAIIPLFAAIGLAVDVGRGYLLQSKLSYAIDAAGLAGGRAFDTDDRLDDVMMFFEANFPDDFMGAAITGGAPSVTFNDDDNTIRIEAEATIPTHFLAIANVDQITVSARTVIQREMRGMELVLVMDNTGSMRSGAKIDAMKDAASALVEILYGERETVPNFWVGVVPYAATVNIGAEREDWLVSQSYDPDAAWQSADPDGDERFGYHPDHFQPTTWKGCVEARDYPNDSNDEPPSEEAWYPHLWRTTLGAFANPHHDPDEETYDEDQPETWGEFLNGDNEWDPDGAQAALKEDNNDQNDGTGPNLGCGPAITPLVAEKTTIQDAIDEMLPWHRGGTMANLGLAWGWRVLSPKWQGLWGGDTPDDLPLAYETPSMEKVVILLTDGVNEWYDWPGAKWTVGGEDHYSGMPGSNQYPGTYGTGFKSDWPGADYTAYGRLSEGRLGTTSNGAAKTVINSRMLELCSAMKAENILIYTITFRLTDSTTQNLYRNCATSPDHYFNSPSNSDLQQVFVEIANELSSLRIAE